MQMGLLRADLRIRNLLEGKPWTLAWTSREANKVADSTAKLTVQSGVEFYFDILSADGIPSAFLSLISSQEESTPLV